MSITARGNNRCLLGMKLLTDFMEERSEELMSLMLEEWNIEDAWEEGLEQGRH